MKNTHSFEIKVSLTEMLKGGVIMDVINPEQAKIAEEAGAWSARAPGGAGDAAGVPGGA